MIFSVRRSIVGDWQMRLQPSKNYIVPENANRFSCLFSFRNQIHWLGKWMKATFKRQETTSLPSEFPNGLNWIRFTFIVRRDGTVLTRLFRFFEKLSMLLPWLYLCRSLWCLQPLILSSSHTDDDKLSIFDINKKYFLPHGKTTERNAKADDIRHNIVSHRFVSVCETFTHVGVRFRDFRRCFVDDSKMVLRFIKLKIRFA